MIQNKIMMKLQQKMQPKQQKTMTIKQAKRKMPDKSPGGSWWTKVPLGHAISTEYLQQSQGQGLAPSS